GERVLQAGDGGRRIAATHHGDGTAFPRLDHGVRNAARAGVERRRLEHAHGPVPEDRPGSDDAGAVVEPGGLVDVEDGEPGRDAVARDLTPLGGALEDRKSTRLNSSHVAISYAVFCLKKKKQQ